MEQNAETIGMLVLHAIWMIVIVALCLLVLITYALNRHIVATASNLYSINIVVVSLLIGIIVLPIQIAAYVNSNTLPNWVCGLNQYVLELFVFVSLFSLFGYWLDLMLVVFKRKFLYKFTGPGIMWFIAGLWAILSGISEAFSFQNTREKMVFTVCYSHPDHITFYKVVKWIDLMGLMIPLSIVIVTFQIILFTKDERPDYGNLDVPRHNTENTYLLGSYLFGAFVICQTPLYAYYMRTFLLKESPMEHDNISAFQFFLIFSYINAFLNPMWVLMFQKNLKERICKKRSSANTILREPPREEIKL